MVPDEDVDCDRLDSDPGVGPEISELLVPHDVGSDDELCEVEDGNMEESIGWSTKGSFRNIARDDLPDISACRRTRGVTMESRRGGGR